MRVLEYHSSKIAAAAFKSICVVDFKQHRFVVASLLRTMRAFWHMLRLHRRTVIWWPRNLLDTSPRSRHPKKKRTENVVCLQSGVVNVHDYCCVILRMPSNLDLLPQQHAQSFLTQRKRCGVCVVYRSPLVVGGCFGSCDK